MKTHDLLTKIRTTLTTYVGTPIGLDSFVNLRGMMDLYGKITVSFCTGNLDEMNRLMMEFISSLNRQDEIYRKVMPFVKGIYKDTFNTDIEYLEK